MNANRIVEYVFNLDRHLTDKLNTYDCCRIQQVIVTCRHGNWEADFKGCLLKKDGTSRQYAAFKYVYPNPALREELTRNYIGHAKRLEQEYCRAQLNNLGN